MGVSKSLGYLVGGTNVPRKFGVCVCVGGGGVSTLLGYRIIGPGGNKLRRIFGMGVPKFLARKGVPNIPGGAKYPRMCGMGGAEFPGVPNIL